ncbi:MAG: COG1361 S-layer family protein [Candidatus Nanohaloarchaea archaeon]
MKKKGLLLTLLIAFSALTAAQTGPSTSINVNLIKSEPVPLQTSEYADVWVKVTNSGDSKADNATVKFDPTFPFHVDPDEKTTWNIGTLRPGEEYYIHLQVKVDGNAVQGKNYLNFKTSSGMGNTVITEKVPVEVRSDNNVLSIESIDLPSKVAPGSDQRMTLTLKNRADSMLKNVELSMDLKNLPFATGNTTSKMIGKIEKGDSVKVSYNLRVGQGADNDLYRLPLELQYENEAGTQFTRDTTTGVVVGGEPGLEVGINNQDTFTPGKTGSVTLRLVNRGYGDANFVSMTLENGDGYEVISPETVYLGNMASDDYQTAEYRIYVSDPDVELPVKLDYRTLDGRQVTETDNVSLNVYSGSELSRYGMAGSGSTLVIAIVVAAIVIGGIYYWRRRRRNKEVP